VHWYFEVLRKYAEFDGRARRKEYWMFSLISILVSMAFGFVAGLVGGMMGLSENAVTMLALVYSAAVLIPSVAVWVRRMHDTGRSGWWCLLILVPIVGAIALLVFALQDSEPGTNAYGRNPKTSMA
jgi:uncharacterized membrane protein YhaH (DUF805 family)